MWFNQSSFSSALKVRIKNGGPTRNQTYTIRRQKTISTYGHLVVKLLAKAKAQGPPKNAWQPGVLSNGTIVILWYCGFHAHKTLDFTN